MQLFSIGNLITFCAVLLILVILRALDRNNRSLEKLKRFSDKIGANISALAEEKTAQIRELVMALQENLAAGTQLMSRTRSMEESLQARARAVEEAFQAKTKTLEESLQARTRTAEEAFQARARSVEEGLHARTAETEEIRRRLLTFEKSFSDLASVSTRLDHAVKKLREESGTADAVSRKITDAAARLEKVEKKLPEMEAGAGARARQVLEAARTELIQSVEAKVGALATGVDASEKRLKDFSAYMARLEAREEQAEKERAAFLSRSLETFEADLTSRLSRARERGETLEDEVFSRLAVKIREDEAAFAGTVQAIERRLADYQGDVDYRVKALEESSNMDSLRASLDESLVKLAEGARAEMKDLAAGLVAGWEGEIAAATRARNELHAGLAEVHAGLEELKTRAYQDVEKGLSVFEDEFFADLRQRAAQSMDKVEGFEADLKTRIASSDELLQSLRQRISTFENELNGMVSHAVQTVESRLADYQGDVDNRLKGLEESRGDLESARAAISQEIQKALLQSRAEIKDMAAGIQDGFDAEWRQKAAQSLEKVEGFEAELKARITSSDESLQSLRQRVSAFENDLNGIASGAVQAIEARLANYEGDVDNRLKGFEDSLGAVEQTRASISREIQTVVVQARAEIKEMAARVEDGFGAEMRQQAAQSLDKHQGWRAGLEKRMGDFESELKARLASSDEAMQGLGDALRQEVEKTRKGASLAIEKETQTLRETLDASVRKSQREIETRLRELSTELEVGRKELGDVLDASRAEVVAWEGRARQQLSETEVSVAEKISRLAAEAQSSISAVHDDFVAQKDEMAAVFAQERSALKAELKEIAERVSSFEAELKRSSETTLEGIRGQMEKAGKGTTAALEKELASLREALESRTSVMHGEIDTRMKELAALLEAGRKEVAAQAESALGAIRGSFVSQRDELVAESSQEREALRKQLAEMGEKIGSFDAELSRTTDSTMEAIQVLRDALHEEVEKARGEASLAMEKDLVSLRDSLEGASHKMQKEIEARMGSITGEMEASRKEVSQLLEASSTYVTAWEAKTRQKISEAEAAIAKKVALMESKAGASVEAVKEAFASQREELVKASAAESQTFRTELAEIGQRISALKADLTASSGETLEKLANQAESLQAESQKRMHEFQADVETRIKEYRQLMAESREKAEAVQEKLFARIEESYRLMSTNITDIDKRVKSFTAQTRLFERADTLKAALEGNIEEMKKEIAKLGVEKAELAETELQLSRTRKLADEVGTKLTRFLTEKRRIDEMEGEFKKLLTLSRDIDLKVSSLSGSHDALQQIQAKVREFEEMGKVVETGVERLDKKQEIITVTAEGVDKNFQRLETIEKTLKSTDQEASTLEQKVRSLMAEYDMLAGRKKDAETAVEISGKLSGVIQELEQRLEKAQNSREWMARTETRFEEIGRQAQEQVRLLESIVKSETRKEKGDRGAPPMDKRDTVVKLSHQGWSVQEISRVTQLSRGEVELILELAPKV